MIEAHRESTRFRARAVNFPCKLTQNDAAHLQLSPDASQTTHARRSAREHVDRTVGRRPTHQTGVFPRCSGKQTRRSRLPPLQVSSSVAMIRRAAPTFESLSGLRSTNCRSVARLAWSSKERTGTTNVQTDRSKVTAPQTLNIRLMVYLRPLVTTVNQSVSERAT